MKFTSNQEFYKSLEESIYKMRNMIGKPKLGLNHCLIILLQEGEFKLLQTTENSSRILIPDYDNHCYTEDIKLLVKHLVEVSHLHGFYYKVIQQDVIAILQGEIEKEGIIETIKLPPSHLISCKKGIYNLKTKKYLRKTSNAYEDYYFPTTYNFDRLQRSETNPQIIALIENVHKLWSDDNPIKEKTIKNLLLGSLMGLETQLQVIIEGPGGNGKSTFLKECQTLAGKNQFININLHDFMSDPIFGQIKPYHKLIAGDDLLVNWVMGESLTNRFKQFVVGSPISVDRKYLTPIDIVQKGLKIQMTNDFMRLKERGQAINDRILYFRWTSVNFRHEESLTESQLQLKKEFVNLFGKSFDEILNHPETEEGYIFFSHLVTWLLSTEDLPTKQTFWDLRTELLSELGEALDSSKDFVDETLEELEMLGTFKQRMIPLTIIYDYYVKGLKFENPGAKPLRAPSFYERLMEFLKKKEYNHERIDKRARLQSIPVTDFNIYQLLPKDETHLSTVDKQLLTKWTRLLVDNQITHPFEEAGFWSKTQQEHLLNELAMRNGLSQSEFLSQSYNEIIEQFEIYKTEM